MDFSQVFSRTSRFVGIMFLTFKTITKSDNIRYQLILLGELNFILQISKNIPDFEQSFLTAD